MIDATTGGHIWAERYDGKLEDVFALQDKVTRQIVAALAVNLTKDEDTRQAQKQTDNPEAYDTFLQGWTHYRQFTRKDFVSALKYFKQAVQLDPNYSRAYAAISLTYTYATIRGWHFRLRWCQAPFHAESYLQLAMKNPTDLTHRAASMLRSQQGRHEEALAEAAKMIALNSNDAENYDALGNALLWAGSPKEAIDALNKAIRLDPLYPATYLEVLGIAYFNSDQFELAAEAFLKARTLNPGLAAWTQAAVLGHLGREDEAETILKRYREYRGRSYSFSANRVLGWYPYQRRQDVDRLGTGLVKAGLCCQSSVEKYLTTTPRAQSNFAGSAC